MGHVNWIVVLIICMTVACIVNTWIRAKHGYSVEGTWGNEVRPPNHKPGAARKRLETELATRDATIANLEERLRVLERIVTDRSDELSSEIEQLRS